MQIIILITVVPVVALQVLFLIGLAALVDGGLLSGGQVHGVLSGYEVETEASCLSEIHALLDIVLLIRVFLSL